MKSVREMVLDLAPKRRLHRLEFLDRHGQGIGHQAVRQFVDHLVADVSLLGRRQSVDEALVVHFPNDHLIQW